MTCSTVITYRDTTTEVFGYDALGNLTSYTDNLNQSRTFPYDDADRLTMTYTSDSSTVEFTYDYVGNVLSCIERNEDALTFTCDDLDRLLTVERSAAIGNSTPEWKHTCTYGKNNNHLSLAQGAPTTLWEAEDRRLRDGHL